MSICRQLCEVLLFISCTIDIGSFATTSVAHVRLYPHMLYSHSFHRHFLGTFSSGSMMNCLWKCHYNEYCRTATYRPMEQNCYLYEEYSYVGTMSPAADGSIVLEFNFCPTGVNHQEPASICFGSERGSVPMQQVMNGLRLVRSYPNVAPFAFVLAPGEAWMPVFDTRQINIYSFQNYNISRSITTFEAFGYFEFYSDMTHLIGYGNNGMYLSWLNRTLNPGVSFWTPCISITGSIIVPSQSSNLINVYNRTTGLMDYNITGAIDLTAVYYKFACVVYDETLYVASNNAIQRVSVAAPGGIQPLTTIFNFTTKNPTFITTDASKRLYSSCVECPQSNQTFIMTTDGTLVATWPQMVAFAQGKASKHKYYFVTSTLDNFLSFYEY